jgi:hypothetical protein
MLIEGKVATILNERELVINKGETAGVTKDMIFGVLETREGIRDPDTKEVLGSVESVKIRVKVVDVQPKLSVCRTYETYQTNIGGKGQSLFPSVRFFEPPPNWVTRVKTLKPADAPFEELDEKGSFVRIGDRVRQLESEL